MKKLVLLLIVLCSLTHARTINVPADFETIQGGINAAANGDTVLVAPQVYYENVDLSGKSIVLASRYILSGDSTVINNTVIDGGNIGAVVRIIDSPDLCPEVNGFTIQNGKWEGDDPPLFGNGLICISSTCRLKNLKIHSNEGFMSGGFYFRNAKVEMEKSEITDNLGKSYGYAESGGLYALNSTIYMKNVVMRGNRGDYSGACYLHESDLYCENVEFIENVGVDGVGCIWLEKNQKMQLVACDFIENRGYQYGVMQVNQGGKIVLDSCNINDNTAGECGGFNLNADTVIIRNSRFGPHKSTKVWIFHVQDSYTIIERSEIYHNTIPNFIDGVFGFENSKVEIANSTFFSTVEGSSNPNSYDNGAVVACSNVSLSLINCILWMEKGKQINMRGNNIALSIAYCDIKEGRDGVVGDGQVDWLEGNIDQDPLWLDPENSDFTLLEDSPCIDAGIAFYCHEGDTLVNIMNGDYNGLAPDIGARESIYSTSRVTPKDTTRTPEPPKEFSLYNNFPNPFNPTTTISFDLPKDGFVTLKIYDITGRVVRVLKQEQKSAGAYSVLWDGLDDAGQVVAAGVYLYQIEFTDDSGERMVQTKKMSLVK